MGKQYGPSNPDYIPTPEEIRAACKEIQEGWDELERQKRLQRTVGSKYYQEPYQPGTREYLSIRISGVDIYHLDE